MPGLDALPDEHVERDEPSRDLGRELVHAALGRVQPRLHRVEVEDAVALDDDLAVERRERRQELPERSQLGEVAEQRTGVARPQAQLAASRSRGGRGTRPTSARTATRRPPGVRGRAPPPSAGTGWLRGGRPDARPARAGRYAIWPCSKLLRSLVHASRRRHRSRSRHPARARRAVDVGRRRRRAERHRLDPVVRRLATSRCASPPR